MTASARSLPSPATIADLLALPDEPRYEIIDGDLIAKEAASGRHGAAQLRFGSLMRRYDRRPGGRFRAGWWFASEVLIEFGSTQVYRPDIAEWRRERLVEMRSAVPITVRPDWTCEIISISNPSHDTVTRRA